MSTIVAEVVSQIMKTFGLSNYSLYHLDSLLVTLNRPNELIGFIVTAIIGGSAAIVFYYLIDKVGQDYLPYKGIAVGLLAWSFTEILFTSIVEGKHIGIRPIGDYYIHIFSSMVFGFTLGVLIDKYLVKPSKFQNR